MADSPHSSWDADALQAIRLIGDRRYRRRLGLCTLGVLAGMAAWGAWGLEFAGRPWFFLGFWAVFFVVFLITVFLAVLDIWSVRLEFAVKRRELAREFLHETRAAAAPRNGSPRADTSHD